MNRSVTALAVLLGVSLLVNAMAVTRLLAPAESPVPQRPVVSAPAATPSTAAPSNDEADALRAEVARLRQEIAQLKTAPAHDTPPGATTAPKPTKPTDPKIAELLAETEAVDNLFRDLRRLQRGRDQIDKTKYQETVVAATADALGLVDPARARFIAAAQQGAADLEVAWKAREEARKAIPSPDPASQGNRDQYMAINKAWQEQVKATAAALNAALDGSQPTQKSFMSKTEMFASSYLAPAGGNRMDRFDRRMDR